MKKHLMSGVAVLAMLLCLGSVPVKAQDNSKVDIFVGYSYLLNNFTTNFCNSGDIFSCIDPGNHGFDVAATWNFNRHVGLEANVSGNYGNTTIFSDTCCTNFSNTEVQKADTTTYLFGPKLTYPVGNFDMFTHFLVGAMHVHQDFEERCCTTTATPTTAAFKGTGFGMKVGGGVDWNHGRWGVRILEVDFIHGAGGGTLTCSDCGTDIQTGTGTENDVALATGFKIRFGK